MEKMEGQSTTGQYTGKASKYGTHQWNASGNVATEILAAIAAVREKCERSGHQEKASK